MEYPVCVKAGLPTRISCIPVGEKVLGNDTKGLTKSDFQIHSLSHLELGRLRAKAAGENGTAQDL